MIISSVPSKRAARQRCTSYRPYTERRVLRVIHIPTYIHTNIQSFHDYPQRSKFTSVAKPSVHYTTSHIRAKCVTYPSWSKKKILTALRATRVHTWESPGVAAVLGPRAWAKTLSMGYTDPCQFNVVARHLSEVPSCCPRGPLHWQTAEPDNTQIHFTDKRPRPDIIQYKRSNILTNDRIRQVWRCNSSSNRPLLNLSIPFQFKTYVVYSVPFAIYRRPTWPR